MREPSYDLRSISLEEVRTLCETYHGYGSAGGLAVYAFGVFEADRIIAAYAWQPPAPGAAKSVCPEAPSAVLALSRMVAVPREDRTLRHVSTPLRRQMRAEIDRGRWPVLVTYSDESLGHTGHVYKCSGWQPTTRNRMRYYLDEQGRRVSVYRGGAMTDRGAAAGSALIQRWEHWACARGEAAEHMRVHGWRRVAIPGKVWRSGGQAHRWERAQV